MKIEIELINFKSLRATVTTGGFLRGRKVQVYEGRNFLRGERYSPDWVWTCRGILATPKLSRKLSRLAFGAGL